MTTIAQLIAQLLATADKLDTPGHPGVETQAFLAWCDGWNLGLAQEIDVDVMTRVDDTGAHAFVMVRGHPHLEPGGAVTMRSPVADADTHLLELLRADRGTPSITCPKCSRTSYSPGDIENRYCGNCHEYHADMT